MAGDIKRQRKSWTLQDRSKVSINILRANLAEEGDEDAQLDVAKRLLQESAGLEVPEATKNENARLALYWLIKSSEQGNEEATLLLEECLQSGRGLTAQNILDVRTCVTTPKHEKLTFKAARLLHRKLSNGEEFITTTQLLARVNMNRKNVTFEEQSNESVLHGEVRANEDNNQEQEHVEVREENSTDSGTGGSTPDQSEPASTPHPLLKDIRLNETFVVSSQGKWSSSSNSGSSFSPTLSSSPKKEERSFATPPVGCYSRPRKSSSVDTQSIDLQLAMTQSGKKLTLQDLLNVAKDFNGGRGTDVSVDERNKMLGRHHWDLNSFPSTFLFQLLLVAVFGKVLAVRDALAYTILLGMLWSAYNLCLWKLRYQNFKEWKLAFESVLKEESWETVTFKQRLSHHYMTPHLVVLSIGSGLLSFFNASVDGSDPLTVLIVAMGVLAMISIQFGVLNRVLPTWQQILILSSSLIYYRSSIVTRLLGDSIAEQTRFLHEPLISVGGDSLNNLYLSISIFPVLVCTCLLTTVRLSLDRLVCETIPETVFTLWLVKFVRESEECEIKEFYAGIAAGFILSCAMVLLCSKIELWKVIMGMMAITISGLILTEVWHITGGEALKSELAGREMRFLEWEDYDSSCHRKAWVVLSPAATQIKCSSLYDDVKNPVMVKWKGRISIVKVEKLSRSFFTSNLEDAIFDIGVGIYTGGNKDDGGSKWQSFLSGTSEGSESVAPATVIIKTDGLGDRQKKRILIDHILNLKSGDKVEFVGKLQGSTAGSLKPKIVGVQKIQCLSCATADYEEFIIEDQKSFHFDWGWLREAIGFYRESDMISAASKNKTLDDYKNVIFRFLEKLRNLIVS